eukprot:872484-Rhodomonas_salina.1
MRGGTCCDRSQTGSTAPDRPHKALAHDFSDSAFRQSGEDRRKKIPVGKRAEKPLPPLLEPDWEEKGVDVTEGFFTLKNKEKLYWCTLVPKEIKKVERVLIYFHGVTGSSAYL